MRESLQGDSRQAHRRRQEVDQVVGDVGESVNGYDVCL